MICNKSKTEAIWPDGKKPCNLKGCHCRTCALDSKAGGFIGSSLSFPKINLATLKNKCCLFFSRLIDLAKASFSFEVEDASRLTQFQIWYVDFPWF